MKKQYATCLLAIACAIAAEARKPNYDERKAGSYTLEDPLVFADGRESPLSRADADILSALHSADGAFLTCSEIISRSRGDGYAMDAGTIRSEIFRLKTKLGKDGERIQGERGFGYRLA